MMPEPLVSIVMNCYNGEKYLREAIDSVYLQTYQNWEIIFWDNASTDSTAEIAKSYDEKLKYFKSQETTILGVARVQATKKATGKYIAFLDVDDIWIKDKLEKQLLLFNDSESNVGFVYGRSEAIIEDKSKDGFIIKDGLPLPEGDVFSELAKENIRTL
jgi:glycosyltransferase involved in cell wall biosynthesis